MKSDFLKAAEYAERADRALDNADYEVACGRLDLAHGYRLEASGWHRFELAALRGGL